MRLFLERIDLWVGKSNINKLVFAFIVSALICIVIPLFAEFRYMTNDDWAMMQIASGGFSGYTSPYLGFTNVIIGQVLVLLYDINRSINWYTCYLLSINFMAWVTLLYVFLRMVNSIKVVLTVFIFIVLLLLMRHFYNMQFTITAATAYISGIGLLWINREHIRFNKEVVIGILFIVLSGLIRKDVLVQMTLGIIPILAFQLFNKQFMVTIAVAISIVFFYTGTLYENMVYEKEPEWAEFKELLGYRELENKYLTYDSMEDVMKEINWSENDFFMYKNFLSDFDNTVFTKEKVIYMTEKFREMKKDYKVFYSLEALANGAKIYLALIALLIIIPMLWIDKKHRLMLGVLYVWTLAGCLAVGYMGYQVKDRVVFDYLLLWGLFGALYVLDAYKNGSIKRYVFNKLLIIILIVLSAWDIINRVKRNNKDSIKQQSEEYRDYLALDALELPYYSGLLAYDPTCFGLFRTHSNDNMYCLGWTSGIPFNKEKINSQCNKVGARSVYDKEIEQVTWLFDISQGKIKCMVTRFYEEHYGNNVVISESEETLVSGFKVHKVNVEFK